MLRYRLLLGAAPGDAPAVREHASRAWGVWLARKGLVSHEDALGQAKRRGLVRLRDGVVSSRSDASDGSTRWRLVESHDTNRWTSTLTVAQVPMPAQVGNGLGAWVEFTIDSSAPDESSDDDEKPTSDETAPAFFLPRLSTYLLTGHNWYDARNALGTVHEVDRNRVPALAAFLTGQGRRLPAVVFSPPPQGDRAGWETAVADVARAVQGTATTWRLAPDATDMLVEKLGRDLAVWGGAVRTYLPGVRPGVPAEIGYTTRHRVLGWNRLQGRPEIAATMIGRSSRLALLEATPWTEPQQVLDEVSVRIADVPRLVLSPATVAPSGDLSAVVEEQKAHLARAIDVVAELRAEALSLASQAEAALDLARAAEEAKVDALHQARETAADNESTLEELTVANAMVRNLGLALAAMANPGDETLGIASAVGADEYMKPEDFEDLLLMLDDIPEITFTGDARMIRGLDRHTNRRAWTAKAWEAVLVMVEYVRAVAATTYSGTFAQWCDGGAPAGARTLPVGPGRTLVPVESETVKQDPSMAELRLLTVPTSVDSTGRVHMWQHIRIGGGGEAPRIHYVESGAQIYIGYIGPHLKNTLT